VKEIYFYFWWLEHIATTELKEKKKIEKKIFQFKNMKKKKNTQQLADFDLFAFRRRIRIERERE
jgi:hypothetical protein